jgi:hypothetical protein
MTADRFKPELRGTWKDQYFRPDGEPVAETDWTPNQIQDDATKITAGLLKGEMRNSSFSPLQYMAIGHGDSTWDTSDPSTPTNQSKLTDEYFRKEISMADSDYLDAFTKDGGSIVATPSRFFQLSIFLGKNEANGIMREFGLFGGPNVDGTTDSGLIFNWITHSKIDKDTSLTIVRTVEVEILLP